MAKRCGVTDSNLTSVYNVSYYRNDTLCVYQNQKDSPLIWLIVHLITDNVIIPPMPPRPKPHIPWERKNR